MTDLIWSAVQPICASKWSGDQLSAVNVSHVITLYRLKGVWKVQSPVNQFSWIQVKTENSQNTPQSVFSLHIWLFYCITCKTTLEKTKTFFKPSSPKLLGRAALSDPEALPTQPSSGRSRIREQHSWPAAKPCHNKDEENKMTGKGKETIQTKERQPCCKQGQRLVDRGPGFYLNQNNLKVWVFFKVSGFVAISDDRWRALSRVMFTGYTSQHPRKD